MLFSTSLDCRVNAWTISGGTAAAEAKNTLCPAPHIIVQHATRSEMPPGHEQQCYRLLDDQNRQRSLAVSLTSAVMTTVYDMMGLLVRRRRGSQYDVFVYGSGCDIATEAVLELVLATTAEGEY